MKVPAYLDILALPRAIGQTYQHAWRRGANPLTETISCLIGSNTWAFFVPLKSGWRANVIAKLLASYGITIFGVFEFNGELVFAVRSGQAHFAQWLLLREGVPLEHGLLTDSAGRVYGPATTTSSLQQPESAEQAGIGKSSTGGEIHTAKQKATAILDQIDKWLGPSSA